jgi:signal transduction histidine kinase
MKVLVADDDPTARLLLQRWLERWDHEVVTASNLAEARAGLAGEEAPRLAILDWLMPDGEGVELCRELRAGPGYTYVILCTVREGKENIVAGLEAGADDYLTKPINPDELRVRLEVGIRILRYEAELERFANEMEELAQDRARQLVHSDRLASIGTMAAGIVHEIRNPLSYIGGNAQVLLRYWEIIGPCLEAGRAAGVADPARLDHLQEQGPVLLENINKGADRIVDIVSGLTRYARRHRRARGSSSVAACLDEALEMCAGPLKHHVKVCREVAEDLPPVRGEGQELQQVFVNLFVNAADAIREVGRGTLTVRARRDADDVVVEVEDTGPGIPEEHLEEIWQPFFTSKEEDKGTGLGLSICREIVERRGGALRAYNHPAGACFEIRLPLDPDAEAETER